MDLKKTPLFDMHLNKGAKMVEFAGYMMPIQYPAGILKEHKAVRERVGMFDVSHMGEICVTGTDARLFLNRLITSDISNLKPGKIKYGILCHESGTALDDILVYCIAETAFMVVVNASNRETVYAWFTDHQMGDVVLKDISNTTALIAVQGPYSETIMLQIAQQLPLKFYSFLETVVLDSISCLISRTGYTGEDGFEIYVDAHDVAAVWTELEKHGVEVCGLGARDTLRLEAGLPLYGHELTESLTPLDAGLDRFVKLDKKEFIGQEALRHDSLKECIGFELEGRHIAREGAQVFRVNDVVGVVTSGTFSPTLQKGIGFASIQRGTEHAGLTVEIRGKRVDLHCIETPFYERGGK